MHEIPVWDANGYDGGRHMMNGRASAAILLIAAAVLSLAGCAAHPVSRRDDFRGRDKAYHAAVSMIIGGSATAAARNNGVGAAHAPLIGISAAITIGAGKEWYDLEVRGTFWSWKDLFWDVAGGAAGAYLVTAVD